MGELQRYARDGGVGTAPCAADMRRRCRAPGTLLRRAIPGSDAQSLDPMPALAGERDWLLARPADTPNVTSRALVGKLTGRGIMGSHTHAWHFPSLTD